MPEQAPNPKNILAMARAFQDSRILLTAVELDLFTALDNGPLSFGQAAEAVGADPRATHRILAALAALGLVERSQDGRFANTPESAMFLSHNSRACLGSLMHLNNLYKRWETLTRAVRAGTRVSDIESRSESETRDFIAAMHHRATTDAKETADHLDLAGVRRFLDVGGGSGVYSMAMCRAEPGLSAVVLDLPTVTSLTREYVAQAGFADRISTMDGDYLEADFGSGFDLILFSAIIHINPPEQNANLVRKAFAALNPGGRLAVKDFILDDNRTSPRHGAIFALNMLVNTAAGDTYTENEVRGWMASAGFARAERIHTGGNADMILAVKQ